MEAGCACREHTIHYGPRCAVLVASCSHGLDLGQDGGRFSYGGFSYGRFSFVRGAAGAEVVRLLL
jgi:hypothetical protein